MFRDISVGDSFSVQKISQGDRGVMLSVSEHNRKCSWFFQYKGTMHSELMQGLARTNLEIESYFKNESKTFLSHVFTNKTNIDAICSVQRLIKDITICLGLEFSSLSRLWCIKTQYIEDFNDWTDTLWNYWHCRRLGERDSLAFKIPAEEVIIAVLRDCTAECLK